MKNPTLSQLYESYIEQHKDLVSPGTWANGYLVALALLHRSPYADAKANRMDRRQAFQFYDWAIANLTLDSARRLIMQLNACYNWALDREIVKMKESPFRGMAGKVRKQFKSAKAKLDINPFTATERDTIIQAFQENEHYCHYSNYVRFCFFTGCRPSEAIALQWNDIALNFSEIIFRRSIVAGKGGQYSRNQLKTQSLRTFPCNSQVRNILADQRSHTGLDIVFPNKKGNYLAAGYFCQKPWKSVMAALPILYRKPYTMRHTFITLCLDRGLDAKDVAQLVGNSPEIIYKHYAGSHYSISVPTL